MLPKSNDIDNNKNLNANTPVQVDRFKYWLKGYVKKESNFIVNGFTSGFDIGFRGDISEHDVDNLLSAKQNPDIVEQKIKNEIEANRIKGPFKSKPFPVMQLSPIGLVEKKTPGKFRMIHHLSFPEGCSINDGIAKQHSEVQYASIQDAIDMVKKVGPNSYCAKTDIANAFRIINIRESQYCLFGFKWNGEYYYDQNLQMGASSSCKIFERVTTGIEWIAKNKLAIPTICHILDDFFLVEQDYDKCKKSLNRFLAVCKDMGVPISEEKTFLPSQVMSFVGYEIDTKLMEVRLPSDKLANCKNLIEVVLGKEKISLRELQSIIGTLNFACAVVLPGRAFLRRLIDLTMGVLKPHFRIRLTREVKADLEIWLEFLDKFNGKSMILSDCWLTSEQLNLFTDASTTIGYGAVFGSHWFSGIWDDEWKCQNIAILELYPITLAVEIWGPHLKNQFINFYTDNMSLVSIINKQTSKNPFLMSLVRRLVLSCLRNNINFRSFHIMGSKNILADALSRQEMQKFHKYAPWADPVPAQIPTLPVLKDYKKL